MQASTQIPTPVALPDDIAQCHHVIEHLHAMVLELNTSLVEQQRREARFQQQIEALLKRLYGSKSERIDPAQLVLFGQEMNSEPQPETVIEEAAPTFADAAPKKKGHGRKPLPEDLPRQRIVHDVAEQDKTCPECGAAKKRIGEDISEQLEYVPASLFVLEHVYPKFACTCCQEHVVIADKAPKVIEKGIPGPGLVAHVVVSKYCDHLPLYRQEQIFARYGAHLSRKTLCGWVLQSAEKLRPLVEAMQREVLASRVLHTDDTPVDVQDERGGVFTGRFWVYAGDDAHPYTVYDYTASRRRDGPASFLDGYKGYLQADAFGGYDGIYASGDVIECACWAHARRKFYDARSTDSNRAHTMLAWIGQLYAIEREAKGMTDDERRDMRDKKSKPILDAIKPWLDKQQETVLPKSPLAQAVAYALNNWTALVRYLDDGVIAIDNNVAENAIRGIALGRKNWLFLGSNRGGRAAAIHYSLNRSAKRHGLDPYVYLRDVLVQITAKPDIDLSTLFPDRWKAAALKS